VKVKPSTCPVPATWADLLILLELFEMCSLGHFPIAVEKVVKTREKKSGFFLIFFFSVAQELSHRRVLFKVLFF